MRSATLGNFPAIGVKWKPVLSDKDHISFLVDRDDTRGLILEMDCPVNARPARWAQNFMVFHENPFIFVHLLKRLNSPGVCDLVHVFSARGQY